MQVGDFPIITKASLADNFSGISTLIIQNALFRISVRSWFGLKPLQYCTLVMKLKAQQQLDHNEPLKYLAQVQTISVISLLLKRSLGVHFSPSAILLQYPDPEIPQGVMKK